MCSGSEEGSYLRLIDFVHHSTLGLRVIKKKKKKVLHSRVSQHLVRHSENQRRVNCESGILALPKPGRLIVSQQKLMGNKPRRSNCGLLDWRRTDQVRQSNTVRRDTFRVASALAGRLSFPSPKFHVVSGKLSKVALINSQKRRPRIVCTSL